MHVEINLKDPSKFSGRKATLIKRTLLRTVARQLKKNLEKNSPQGETNVLASSWGIEIGTDEAVVNSNTKYAKFVNDGTGIYGSHGARIVPVHARYLRWVNHGVVHYAKSVAGQPGKHFQEKSVNQLDHQLPAQMDEIITEAFRD